MFLPAEDEEGDDESSSTSTILTKEAVVAFETALNFLQQGDIEMNYDELKAFRALKRKVELHSVANKKQARIYSFFTGKKTFICKISSYRIIDAPKKTSV